MLVPRQQYSRELKIAAMQEIESGKGTAEVTRMFQVSPKRLETWKGEWLRKTNPYWVVASKTRTQKTCRILPGTIPPA